LYRELIPTKEKSMRSLFLIPVLFCIAGMASGQTLSPQEQHAADQDKCAGYGFRPGSDEFAHCMMKLDDKREHHAANAKDDDAAMKARSIRRNGDTRYPVCSAAMLDANLDTYNNAWYGPNCREK
jgi:hypothetical protein